MAVSVASALNVTGTDTDARDYTTASWTPTVGKVYSVAFAWLDLGSAKTTPTISGNNITWVGGTGNEVGGLATEPSIIVWTGYADSSATAGAITFSGCVSSGQTADGAIWGIAELSNTPTNATTVVRQYVATQTANDSITSNLAAFGSVNNATASWVVSYDNASTTGPAITAGTGFAITTGLNAGQAMGGDGVRLAFQFRSDNDTSVTASAAAANDRMLQVAFELREIVNASGSAAVSGDGAISATAGATTRFRSGSLAGDGQVVASGTRTAVAVGAISGDGAISAAGVRTASRSATVDGSGAVAATGVRSTFGSAAVVGVGDLTAAGTRTALGSAAVAGVGDVSASGTRTAVGAATVTGVGDVSATGGTAAAKTGQAAVAGSGLVDAAGFAARAATGTLTGSGTLVASGVRVVSGEALLAGSGALVGTGAGTHVETGSATVAGAGQVAATGLRTAVAVGTAAGSGILVGAGTRTRFGSASLAGLAELAAGGVRTASRSAAITGIGLLVGTAVRIGPPGCATLTISDRDGATLTITDRATATLALVDRGELTMTVADVGDVELTTTDRDSAVISIGEC